jgi:hypothetical protein
VSRVEKGVREGPGGGNNESGMKSTSANIKYCTSLLLATMSSTEQIGFIGTILQPGSSLNPIFLHILDGAFVALFLVFIMLAVMTSGNPHIFALMFIELALWASVKW